MTWFFVPYRTCMGIASLSLIRGKPMSNPEPTHYSVRELAERYGVSKKTFYRLIADGALPAVRVGLVLRVPAAAVASWERANTTTPVAV